MLRPSLVVAALLIAGCTSQPPEQPPPQSAFVLVASRVDLSGDGLFDALNVTLMASPEPLAVERLGFRVDGTDLAARELVDAEAWLPGRSVEIACPAGVHRIEVRVDDEVKKLMLAECGVAIPVAPPSFQGAILDGDADGALDAIELTVVGGGPVDPRELTIGMDNTTLRLYSDVFKSRVARGFLANGSRAFTPCVPDQDQLHIRWRETQLPALTIRGCDVLGHGIDAPVSPEQLDLDADAEQDGWAFTLGAPSDGPFPGSALGALWDDRPTTFNGSTRLDPPPETWRSGGRIVATCPGEGWKRFTLTVNGSFVFRSITLCEEPPGSPLLDLELVEDAGQLVAFLEFSRIQPLEGANVTQRDGTRLAGGEWRVDEARSMPCPGGFLVLRYEDRPAFRGAAPC